MASIVGGPVRLAAHVSDAQQSWPCTRVTISKRAGPPQALWRQRRRLRPAAASGPEAAAAGRAWACAQAAASLPEPLRESLVGGDRLKASDRQRFSRVSGSGGMVRDGCLSRARAVAPPPEPYRKCPRRGGDACTTEHRTLYLPQSRPVSDCRGQRRE
jgi:hypothetical protein